MKLRKLLSKDFFINILNVGSVILFSIFFFFVSIVIGRVFDLDYIDPYDRYNLDPDRDSLTYEEWQVREDIRAENFKDYILDGNADAWVFPPWKDTSEDTQENPSAGCHHNEGG